jgi:hypothetical protein
MLCFGQSPHRMCTETKGGGGEGRREESRRVAALTMKEEAAKQEVARWSMGCMRGGGIGGVSDALMSDVLYGIPANARKCCRPTSM